MKISIILAVCASSALIIALALYAYGVSIAQIHKIKLGDEIIHGLTYNGFINNDTMVIGFGGGKGTMYVKIDKLPFSFEQGIQNVTIYGCGSDWLELSIKGTG